MVGNNAWDGKVLEVIQEGSQSWKGPVIVWNGNDEFPGAHGRRQPISGSGPRQWAQGDTIKLNHCVEAGILINK